MRSASTRSRGPGDRGAPAASIRHADRVLFISDGAVVEDGPVDELLAAAGRFAEFWRHQQGVAQWEIGRREITRR